MTVDLARRISETPTLHTLELHLCQISRMLRKKLTTESAPVCPNIANLRVYMDSTFSETHTQWYGLLLCPHIRTLSVVRVGVGAFPTPDLPLWTRCRLDHLERLALENVDLGDLTKFRDFLATNRTAGEKITHFKLHMDWGITDSEVAELLSALRNAPLEVLVLEGLAGAEFALFECIAELYPHLIALTLVRRQNANQHLNKLAVWPHASWEYGPYFRGFKTLRHFCWNFRTEYWDATPTALLAFESNFQITSWDNAPRPATSRSHDGGDALIDEMPYFLDSHWMALPFVVHCPTLESFSLMDSTLDMVCRIARHPQTGKPIMAPSHYPTHASISWNDQQWNTVSSHWPILPPVNPFL